MDKKTKKLIIFDWGGVVQSVNHNLDYTFIDSWNESISSFSGIQKDWFHSLTSLSKDCNEFVSIMDILNEKDFDKFLESVLEEALGRSISFQELRDFKILAIQTSLKQVYYKEVADIIHCLAEGEECYIGLLSNCGYLDMVRQKIQLPSYDFDFIWRSCEIRLSKPNENIYLRVLDDIKDENIEEILFFDDSEANLEIPKQLGWNVYKVDNSKNDYVQIVKEINKFLNKNIEK